MKNIWPALRLFLWLSALLGLIYPLLVTTIVQFTAKKQADGGLSYVNGKLVGAHLIAQKFKNAKYFWPRPSAVDYNPMASGGSNLSPTSAALQKAVLERRQLFDKAAGDTPSELLFASGSGLDPHISLKTAYYQIGRIAKARGLDPEKGKEVLADLIDRHSSSSYFGLLGKAYINVLELNIALDNLPGESK